MAVNERTEALARELYFTAFRRDNYDEDTEETKQSFIAMAEYVLKNFGTIRDFQLNPHAVFDVLKGNHRKVAKAIVGVREMPLNIDHIGQNINDLVIEMLIEIMNKRPDIVQRKPSG
jgi:hypothetical protein